MKLNLAKRIGAGLGGALLLTCLMTAPTAAQEESAPRIVDEVVAQVNDQVITLSMLQRELREAKEALKQGQGLTDEQAQAEVAKRQPEIIVALINEQLMVQKGKEVGLAEDVERQVNVQLLNIAAREGIKTIEQLEATMRAEHLDPAVVRQTMRIEAMKSAVLNQEVDRKVYFGLTDTEVKSYYEANKEKFRKPETVTLSEIFLSAVGRPDAEVLAHAQRLVAQLRAGADFAATAKTESEREDNNGKRVAPESGGKVGTFAVSEITNKLIADAIRNVQAGGVTEPVKADQGYIIMRVDARTPAGEAVFEENRVREVVAYERLPKERESYLRNLRQEAYVELAPTYRDAVQPLLKTEPAVKTEPVKTASAGPAKKDNKKKADTKKP